LKGLWFAHVGWLFDVEHTNQQRFTPDLLADKAIVKIEKVFPLLVLVSFFLPAVLGRPDHDVLGRRVVRVLLGQPRSGSRCCTT
jgi:hypothetical protein